jgi:hypothetical protein
MSNIRFSTHNACKWHELRHKPVNPVVPPPSSECLGLVWGLVGKLKIHADLPQRLVLVRHCERFAELPGRGFERHGVYKLQNVICVPISTDPGAVANLGLKLCPKHHAAAMPGKNCWQSCCLCGRLHVRFSVRIAVRFAVRFADQSVLQVFFDLFLLKCVDRPCF